MLNSVITSVGRLVNMPSEVVLAFSFRILSPKEIITSSAKKAIC